MKLKLSVNKNREFPAYYLFFIGCVIGIVLPNLIYKMQWKQNTVSALYLMGIYAEKGSREYFWKVLRMRGGLFLLVAGSGLTIFGVLVAVGGIIGNRNGYVDDHVNPSVRISRWFDRHRTDVSSVYYLRTMFFGCK